MNTLNIRHNDLAPFTAFPFQSGVADMPRSDQGGTYWIELATSEKMLFDLPPINFTVPTTMTKITASMTAYSAMSCAESSAHNCPRKAQSSAICRSSFLVRFPQAKKATARSGNFARRTGQRQDAKVLPVSTNSCH